MSHYFVTGGTGVVGTALVAQLLDEPDNEVWLLVRAPDAAALAARVDELFRYWQLGGREPQARRRVHAVRGDASEPRLGLSPTEYESLVGQITHVVHAAGAVRMNLPLEEARRSAVGSAHQIVELASALQRAGRLRKVEFVSTVGVGGRMAVVPEDWIDAERSFHNTYEQSKAEAETIVRDATRRGLPLTVHRPSMVVGDSRTGRIVHFQVFYHLCEFLSGRRTFGLFPPLGRARIDVVPSDYVARVLMRSSQMPELAGRVLHASAGDDALPLVGLRDLVRETLRARGERLPPVVTLPGGLIRAGVAAAAVVAGGVRGRALRTLPIFLDYLSTAQVFTPTHVRGLALRDVVGDRPPGDSWLPTVIGHYLDRRG